MIPADKQRTTDDLNNFKLKKKILIELNFKGKQSENIDNVNSFNW